MAVTLASASLPQPPRVGASWQEAELTQWLKSRGLSLKRGQNRRRALRPGGSGRPPPASCLKVEPRKACRWAVAIWQDVAGRATAEGGWGTSTPASRASRCLPLAEPNRKPEAGVPEDCGF